MNENKKNIFLKIENSGIKQSKTIRNQTIAKDQEQARIQ